MAMSENQIERIAERSMDRLDEQLMNGSISQEEYDVEAHEVDLWVKEQYAKLNVASLKAKDATLATTQENEG